jgi:hypothetical protein
MPSVYARLEIMLLRAACICGSRELKILDCKLMVVWEERNIRGLFSRSYIRVDN